MIGRESPLVFPDFARAPNIAGHPDVYERENEAIDPTGVLWRALRAEVDWAGRTIVDLGCGTGFWLPRYAADPGTTVIGVEPDPDLRARATARVQTPVLAGSAEHLRWKTPPSTSSTPASPTSSRRTANRACTRSCWCSSRAATWWSSTTTGATASSARF
nr:class I SAM-dependent methyltransferase [Saccharothrix sp.]